MSVAAFVVALAGLAAAQYPAYTGQLLVSPGRHAGKCLDADNYDGAPVKIADCKGGPTQKWTFGAKSHVVKIHGNKCLDVKDGKNADGTKLQIWTCNESSSNQKFWYSFWDYTLSWEGKGKCVDLPSGNLKNGNVAQTSENGQYGTNRCGTGSSQSSNCQTVWINDVDDFCVWAPPNGGEIGNMEREVVAYCTKSGRGTRVIPDGTLKGVHFVKTKDYVQVTGIGDFTKIGVKANDDGGELDPHGADGNGNPIGGLVYGNSFGKALQYHEWTSFMSATEFCFRACTGPDAAKNCQHIYDVMGCRWNMPANYDPGTFESCDADNALPMGIYGASTWYQGVKPTPAAHPIPHSSNCRTLPTVTSGPAPAKREHKRRQFSHDM
ncbi:hypothetical protein OPQ81_011630 [Rhizoctonia solani]|nr:hypothetical protein OPQ81_011630 [Rhizoctonia solani]